MVRKACRRSCRFIRLAWLSAVIERFFFLASVIRTGAGKSPSVWDSRCSESLRQSRLFG